MLSRQLRLDVAQLTDVGRKRPHNEDNMAHVIPPDEETMARKGALFIVADGMGGHAAGEVASKIAVDTVTKAYYEDENEDIPPSLINAIRRANTIIHQRADEDTLRSGMGTTCVAAVLCGNIAYIANVGDSRAYIIRQTHVKQISQDHSWVEEQVRAGLLTHDQARSHAQRNVITRCLGTQTDVEVDVFFERLSEGDTFLLCTDGLSGSIREEDLSSIINQFVPQEGVYHLIQRANENGGPDNITAIVVRVLDVGADTPFARYPVPAGTSGVTASGQEIDQDTTQGRIPTSLLGISPRVEDGPKWNTSFETATTGPMPALGSSAPLVSEPSTLALPTRRRLIYPTVALIILILVTLVGSGTYYFVRTNNSASHLSNARSLIAKANAATQNPQDALQYLSQAQQELFSTQGFFFAGDQTTQYKTLQTNLRNTFQQTIAAYNQKELITQLPCNITQSTALSANMQPISLSTMQDNNNAPDFYVLTSEYKLYELDNQRHPQSQPLSKNAVLKMTGSGQHLFALTFEQSGNITNYGVSMFDPAPSLKENPVPVDPELIKQGWVPMFLTAYGNDVYLILISDATPHQARILSYDASNWHNAGQPAQVSLSQDIVSVAAFPKKRLFLLMSDGHVRTLLYSDNGNALLPADVSLQNPVSPPLTTDGTNFAANTPITTPLPPSPQIATSATPDTTLLTAGLVGGTPHLYVVDNPNHRILDLQFLQGQPVNLPQTTPVPTPTPATTPATVTPTPTPSTGVGAVSPSSLKVIQQFASNSLLSSVKSAAVSPDGKLLSLLTDGGNTLTTISTLDKVPSCSPAT